MEGRCQNYWGGVRLDNHRTHVFTWSGKAWYAIVDGEIDRNAFKEVSNNPHTVVLDQGAGPLFITADGAYWAGKRFAIGGFDQRRHQNWRGSRTNNGEVVEFRLNSSTHLWEEVNGGKVVKNDFREVESNLATVTIDQGAGPIYLTPDGAFYDGKRWAVGTFTSAG